MLFYAQLIFSIMSRPNLKSVAEKQSVAKSFVDGEKNFEIILNAV